MRYGPLFRHRWRASSPNATTATAAVRLGGMLLLLGAALYVGAVAEEWIQIARPDVELLHWINGWILPLGALYVIGPPVGLFVWADAVPVFAGGLAVLGVLPALCVPLWTRLLRRVWDRRHPTILEDFQEAES